MKDKIMLGLLLSVLFFFFIAILGVSDGTTGMAIIQSSSPVELPGYSIFVAIIACLVGFVFIRQHHQEK